MLLVATVVALARGAEVPTAELAPTVQAVRDEMGEPIAIVTPNGSQERAVQSLVGSGGYLFANAGSASETRLAELGVSCALFVTRDGFSSVWHVTPVGTCGAWLRSPPPPIPVSPTKNPEDPALRYRRNMRKGVTYAIVLPAVSAGMIAIAIDQEDTGVLTGFVGLGVAWVAPLVVAGHSIGATTALRHSGVPISYAPAVTAIVLDGMSIIFLGVEISSGSTPPVVSVSTWAGAYLLSVTQLVVAGTSSHRADFHMSVIPTVVDDQPGVALSARF